MEQRSYYQRYRETTLAFDDERQESRDIKISNFLSEKLAISNSKIQVDEWFSEMRRTFASLMRSLAWETNRGIGNQMAKNNGTICLGGVVSDE